MKTLRSTAMTKPSMLKLSLLGAFLSLGAFAANDPQAKTLKENAEFVEKAAMASKQQVTLSELAIQQSTNPAVKQVAQQVITDHQAAFDKLKTISASKGWSLPFASIGTGITSTSGSATPGTSDVSGKSESGSMKSESGSTAQKYDTQAKRAAEDVSGDVKAAGEEVATASKKAGDQAAADVNKAADQASASAKKAGDEMTHGQPTIASTKEYEKASQKLQKRYDELTKLSGEKFDKEYLSDVASNNMKAIKLVEKQSKSGWDSDLTTWASETLPTLRHHEELIKGAREDLKTNRPSM